MRLALLLTAALASCGGPGDDRPNVLLVVWDTVRADRLGLYGHELDTTPFLSSFAEGALVFDDCLAPGSSTVPSHASMFTGLHPVEHGANFSTKHLDDSFETLAEVFQRGGYATYLFSANPNIQAAENFHQGFDVEEHPWDERYRHRALEILASKVQGQDRATGLQSQLRTGRISDVELRACGALAADGLESFLAERGDRPWFAFLNYMEAHAPLVPPREYRERTMTPEQVEESYEQDRSWANKWSYTYGFRELPEEYFEVLRGTYDAALLELDDLLADLVARLEAAGELENTIVVVTSDHGEHLGDHELIDHRHSVYQSLLRVPLVLRWTGHVEPGRSSAPVSGLDLFPTLIELAGLEVPPQGTGARHLLEVPADRRRLAEYPDDFPVPTKDVLFMEDGTDLSAWKRELWAWVDGPRKLILGSDGEVELYDLARDPREESDLYTGRTAEIETLLQALADYRGQLADAPAVEGAGELSADLLQQLQSMGYLESGEGDSAAGD